MRPAQVNLERSKHRFCAATKPLLVENASCYHEDQHKHADVESNDAPGCESVPYGGVLVSKILHSWDVHFFSTLGCVSKHLSDVWRHLPDLQYSGMGKLILRSAAKEFHQTLASGAAQVGFAVVARHPRCHT